MRTTLTLDDDIAVLLERERRRRNVTLKQIVNEALREGLAHLQSPEPRRKAYRTRTVDLGRCRVGGLDDVAEALAVAEGEDFG